MDEMERHEIDGMVYLTTNCPKCGRLAEGRKPVEEEQQLRKELKDFLASCDHRPK